MQSGTYSHTWAGGREAREEEASELSPEQASSKALGGALETYALGCMFLSNLPM